MIIIQRTSVLDTRMGVEDKLTFIEKMGNHKLSFFLPLTIAVFNVCLTRIIKLDYSVSRRNVCSLYSLIRLGSHLRKSSTECCCCRTNELKLTQYEVRGPMS